VGDKRRTETLTIYNHPAANTVSDVLRARQMRDHRIEVVDEITVEVRSLNEILKSYLPTDRDFRVLTIDAEGSDYEIISSLDTDQYKPNLILIKDFDFNLSSPGGSKIFTFLQAIGYAPVSHCMVTTLYRCLST
jgi:hypothetical protein